MNRIQGCVRHRGGSDWRFLGIQISTGRLLTLAQNVACSRQSEDPAMSKAMNTKKDSKKKPAKSLMEKRAAKREKKANKGFPG